MLDRIECVAEVDFDADVCRIKLHVNADDEPMGLGPSRGALAELHRLTLNAQSLAFHSQDHWTNGVLHRHSPRAERNVVQGWLPMT